MGITQPNHHPRMSYTGYSSRPETETAISRIRQRAQTMQYDADTASLQRVRSRLPPTQRTETSLQLDLVLRPLEEPVDHRSFLRLLTQLTEVGEVTDEFFTARLTEVQTDKYQRMLVLESQKTKTIVGTGSLIVEPKFIHETGLVGHVEDIVIEETLRGHGLGSIVLQRLLELAQGAGCYKCILDTKEKNVGFYEKHGFKLKDVMMARYFDDDLIDLAILQTKHQIRNWMGHALFETQELDGMRIRELNAGDYNNGFLDLLAQLTTVGEIPRQFFEERLARIEGDKRQHILVIEDTETGQIISTATLLVERKFIHCAGFAGHVEDVVCDTAVRGKGLGKIIIQAAVTLAHQCGCYKVILDCEEKLVGFYEKCGFAQKEVQMACYFDR